MRCALLTVAAVSVTGLLLTGCGGVADPSDNTIDNFAGVSILPGQVNVHEFEARKNGEYSASIIAIAPTQSALLSISLGAPVNSICTPYLGAEAIAGINRPGLNGPINKGRYCIQVFDRGTLAAAQTYTLRVSHP